MYTSNFQGNGTLLFEHSSIDGWLAGAGGVVDIIAALLELEVVDMASWRFGEISDCCGCLLSSVVTNDNVVAALTHHLIVLQRLLNDLWTQGRMNVVQIHTGRYATCTFTGTTCRRLPRRQPVHLPHRTLFCSHRTYFCSSDFSLEEFSSFYNPVRNDWFSIWTSWFTSYIQRENCFSLIYIYNVWTWLKNRFFSLTRIKTEKRKIWFSLGISAWHYYFGSKL